MNSELEEVIKLLRGLTDQLTAIDVRVSGVERQVASLAQAAELDLIPVYLQSRALEINEPEDQRVLLCLDFGTARSKAFATNGADDELLDIAVGARAGSGETHSVISCVFIADDDGRIYFGEVAAKKSERAIDQGVRKRIDSFKEMITNASPGSDLYESVYDKEFNPTSIRLSEGEILSLYLGYLTDLSAIELTERHGVSRYVSRRFTTPVFASEHKEWASTALRRHYAEAVLLADHFSGRWQEGVAVAEAKAALLAVAKRYKEVSYLLFDSEVEPVAAFGSRYRNYDPSDEQRRIISIIDAGAGTTDFATFAVLERPGEGVTMLLVPDSVHAVRKAGNDVDRILRDHILDRWEQQNGVDPTMLARIRADLSLQQRGLKERLFREGRVSYTLVDDTKDSVELPEFLETHKVKQFITDLRQGFEESLKDIHPSWLKEGARGQLIVIVTGGSSSLPMVRDLASLQMTGLSVFLQCVAAPHLPAWVDKYEELKPQFPQLAVAIGGASRELPRLAPNTFAEFSGLSDQGKWVIDPILKGT